MVNLHHVSNKQRRTVSYYPNGASLQWDTTMGENKYQILPLVVKSHHSLPLDTFVHDVKDSGYEGPIIHPKCHNSLHWMDKPSTSDVDANVEDTFS